MLEPYVCLPQEPYFTERLFVNIGLLTVRGTLPKYATLASPSESGPSKRDLASTASASAGPHHDD